MVKLVEVVDHGTDADGNPRCTSIYEYDDGYQLREIGSPYFGEVGDCDEIAMERHAIELRLSIEAGGREQINPEDLR